MLKQACLLFFFLISNALLAQQADSISAGAQMQEVEVTGYLSRQVLLQTPASVAVVNAAQLSNQATESLVPALNTVPGVRMEERSPGSYRLSLRGSLLRSPFGVRNVKVYVNQFPLTDAGGNTYLNLIDSRSLSRIEILKGPDGSLFGANSGGVLLLETNPVLPRSRPAVRAELTGGSYGLVHQNFSVNQETEKVGFSLNQGFQRSDGYRENSALKRRFVQAEAKLKYQPKREVTFFAFYSDLEYQTPGGLTLAQFQENPEQARPATATAPGAAEQKAGIRNKTVFGGLSHETEVNRRIYHTISVFGSSTRYQNPFITNFEKRTESNLGLRTFVQVTSADSASTSWVWTTGLEGQLGKQRILNSENIKGLPGRLDAADKIDAGQHFYFTRFSATLFQRLTLEAALSLNYFRYKFARVPGAPSGKEGNTHFNPVYMPRIATSFLATQRFAVRASASKGYSPPTIAEIRPSGTEVNTQLQAENGWNLETGIRYSHPRNRFQADASVFTYRLQKAIVRQVTALDEEYFTNAGGARQTGWETQVSAWFIEAKKEGKINGLQFWGAFTYNHFRFQQYQLAGADYSGNRLTGVPNQVLSSGFDFRFLQVLALSGQFTYTGRLPLNDANTAYAEPSHLLQAKLRWRPTAREGKPTWEAYFGADNLLNETYSLGHDINAFGGRYYNAAPLRNYYAGLAFAL